MRKFYWICFILSITFLSDGCKNSKDQNKDIGLEMNEIMSRIKSITPKDKDFKFEAPSNWSENLLDDAVILETSKGENIVNVNKIIDGLPATTWQSNIYNPKPEVLIDLRKVIKFNRIIIFNRFTDSRGTGGGNNAAKELQVLTSKDNNTNSLKSVGTFTLSGPKAVCFKKKGKGQVCVFIDNKDPNIIEIEETEGRLIKLIFNAAFWGDAALEEWKTSVALSEIMLFQAK